MEEHECSDEEIFYDCCEDTISDEKPISQAENNTSNLEKITQAEITGTTSKEQPEHDQEEVITSYSGTVETNLCSETESQVKVKNSIDVLRSLTRIEDPETTASDCPEGPITQNLRHEEAVPCSEPATLDQKQIPVLDKGLETESCSKESEGVVRTGAAETKNSHFVSSNIENSENLVRNGDSFGSEPMISHEKPPSLDSSQPCSDLRGAGEPTEEWKDNPLEGTPTTPTELEALAGDARTVKEVEECAPNAGLYKSSIAEKTTNNQPKVVGVSQGHGNDKDQTEGQQPQGQAQYEDQTLVEKFNVIEEGHGQGEGQQPKVMEEDQGQVIENQTLFERPNDMDEDQGQAIEDQSLFGKPKDMEETQVHSQAQGHDQACKEENSENDESSDDGSTLTETEIEERRIEAKKLKDEGNDTYKNGDFVEAERLYTEALKICPKSLKKDRAVMYSNRSACLVQMDKAEPAIEDCSKAVELHPTYVKAFLRRAQLYEKSEKYEEAMEDCNKVLELDPSINTARATLLRLPEEIEKRNEKLKTKMMSSLKDIGNLFLRPFGLSTENFQMQQDPNSGSYNIQFNNGQSGQNNGPGNGI